jgi:hypothetical protein
MKTKGLVLCAAVLLLCAVSATAEFKIYPGARRDQQLEQLMKGDPRNQVENEVYLTPDPFEKVYQFYKGIGAEDADMEKGMPKCCTRNGGTIQLALFTFDGANSIVTSKVWAKIQRPTIADKYGKDVRDVTSIQLVRKK